MLITFRSKAAADVVMYQEHAKRIFSLLHKSPVQGVITATEATQAVATLEQEIAKIRLHPAADDDIQAPRSDIGDDSEPEEIQIVSFATRAYPLLQMLRAAKNGGHDVLWGV